MHGVVSFYGRKEVINVSGCRPGCNQPAQLVIDLLNFGARLERDRAPRALTEQRFRSKWGLLPDNRLLYEALHLWRTSIQRPNGPVLRKRNDSKVLMLGADFPWVHLGEASPSVKKQVSLELPAGTKLIEVDRDFARPGDLSEVFHSQDLRQNDASVRALIHFMRTYLLHDTSDGASFAARLVLTLPSHQEIFEAFGRSVRLEWQTLRTLMLLELLHLVSKNLYVERCWVYPAKGEKTRDGLGICLKPYFVPSTRGRTGCSAHSGKKFQASTAVKRMRRAAIRPQR